VKSNIIDLVAVFALKQRENSARHKNTTFLRKLARDFCLACKVNKIAKAREIYKMYITDEVEEKFTLLIKEEQRKIEEESNE